MTNPLFGNREVKLVGRRIPGSNVPRLDALSALGGRPVGGLDITHVRFHAPFVIPVQDADGQDVAWGVACLGCSIITNTATTQCQLYAPGELVYGWPTAPALVELLGISEILDEPALTIEELEAGDDDATAE